MGDILGEWREEGDIMGVKRDILGEWREEEDIMGV